MKATRYKIKKYVRLFAQKKRLRPVGIQNMSYVYKGTLNIERNEKFVYFLCEKLVPMPVNS